MTAGDFHLEHERGGIERAVVGGVLVGLHRWECSTERGAVDLPNLLLVLRIDERPDSAENFSFTPAGRPCRFGLGEQDALTYRPPRGQSSRDVLPDLFARLHPVLVGSHASQYSKPQIFRVLDVRPVANLQHRAGPPAAVLLE